MRNVDVWVFSLGKEIFTMHFPDVLVMVAEAD